MARESFDAITDVPGIKARWRHRVRSGSQGPGAADLLMRAMVNAVLAAESIPGFPCYRDCKKRWKAENPN